MEHRDGHSDCGGNGALVLEDCRAATIHWGDIPRLKFLMAPSDKRMEEFRGIAPIISYSISTLRFPTLLSFLWEKLQNDFFGSSWVGNWVGHFLGPAFLAHARYFPLAYRRPMSTDQTCRALAYRCEMNFIR